ncbi:GTP-binding protein [Glutamicibacter sp. PS]|uniref:GTP-binding protein n=1 Tax=Glutamicibacter sp. PS TaxID=3075634 RepID=UPI00285125A6|nr:GTP-binding protein [Glutamicibacter sp. PS]MDR4534127.1 GTP-binding protein [Glutamicibacter sp. PS]
MELLVISALEQQARSAALTHAQAIYPDATVATYDALEGPRLLRQIQRPGGAGERAESTFEHWCQGCAFRYDILPTLLRLRTEGTRFILVLPTGWSLATVEHYVGSELRAKDIRVRSAILGLDPASFEDRLWDTRLLSEAGFGVDDSDPSRPGEFLVEDAAWADTLVLAHGLDSALLEHDPAEHHEWMTGRHLVDLLAPHAVRVQVGHDLTLGNFDLPSALKRTRPGHLPALNAHATIPGAGGHRCLRLQAERPLHPERFREALPQLASSCAWIRGTLWMGNSPGSRIALGGVGPRVWMQSTGSWGAETACTQLVLTSDEHEAEEVSALLRRCELNDAELADLSTGLTPHTMEENS